jgi:hypothetical protein
MSYPKIGKKANVLSEDFGSIFAGISKKMGRFMGDEPPHLEESVKG